MARQLTTIFSIFRVFNKTRESTYCNTRYRRRKKTLPPFPSDSVPLQSMRGNRVVVEMKNDVEISGILEETDGNMK